MKWMVRNGEQTHQVDVERLPEGFELVTPDERRRVDLIRLDGAIASLRYVKDGRSYSVSYQRGKGRTWHVAVDQREFDFEVLTPLEAIEASAAAEMAGPSRLEAPIPGKVVSVNVKAGDQVEPGQSLVVLEAMKMENELIAEQGGRVAVVHVEPGRTVDSGEVLIELE